MPDAQHYVTRLRLDAHVPDHDSALALRSRLEALGNKTLPLIIERVAEALIPATCHLRLPTLQLNLGAVASASLEYDISTVFEQALTNALQAALVQGQMNDPHSLLTPAQAALADFETYLRSGILPFHHGTRLAPSLWLAKLAATNPAGLSALLHRLATQRHALTRLLLQTGPEGFQQLLNLLAPADASIILQLLADSLAAHDALPIFALGPEMLDLLLQRMTLEYLLRDAGSQFNRRNYLRFLLHQAAEETQIPYLDMLGLLRTALNRLQTHHKPSSGLPIILSELIEETQTPPTLPGSLMATRLAELLDFINRHKNERSRLKLFLASLKDTDFTELIKAVSPADATLILSYLADLVTLYHDLDEPPLAVLSADGLRQLARLITLLHLLQNASTQFNRLSWLRQLITEIALAENLPYAEILKALGYAAEKTKNRIPTGTSLPGLLADLAAEIPAATLSPLPHGETSQDASALAERLAIMTNTESLRHLLRSTTPKILAQAIDHCNKTTIIALLTRLASARIASVILHQLPLSWRAVGPAVQTTLTSEQPQSLNLAAIFINLASSIGSNQDDDDATMLIARLPDKLPDLWTRINTSPHPWLSPPELNTLTLNPLAKAEDFLRSFQPFSAGQALVVAAKTLPQTLKQRLQHMLAAGPLDANSLIKRALSWLSPHELLKVLLPNAPTSLAAWAEACLNPDQAWEELLTNALQNKPLPAITPVTPGQRLDEAAWLAYFLDHGVLPWWAVAGASPLRALQAARLTTLHSLFNPDNETLILPRLRNAATWLGPEAATALAQRLVPWTTQKCSPLATLTAGLKKDPALDLLLRATAASLQGAKLDLMALTQVPPPPPPTPPPAPFSTSLATLDLAVILAWLDGAPPQAGEHPTRLARALADAIDTANPVLQAYLHRQSRQPEVIARWIGMLPPELLGRLLHCLAPDYAASLLDIASLLAVAWRREHGYHPTGAGFHSGHTLPWAALFAAIPPGRLPDPPKAAAAIAAALMPNDPAGAARLQARACMLAQQGQHFAAQAALVRGSPPQPQTISPSLHKPLYPAKRAIPAPEPEPGDFIYIANAGLILLSPFLPKLFERLELFSTPPGPPRLAAAHASRAVHLLQYLVDGQLNTPEPALVLNKLLCGLPPATPIAAAYEAKIDERSLCDELLHAMITNWPIISNTSADGVQETFLQREGRLRRGDSSWTLTVQRKTLDVLTDQIPWGFRLILHDWMTDPLHVEW